MSTYAILRRSGWRTAGDLQSAAERSAAVGDGTMAEDIRWIRSYVFQEADGTLGTVCIYQATSEEAIRAHARTADLPVLEILPVADTVVVREDLAQLRRRSRLRSQPPGPDTLEIRGELGRIANVDPGG
ncbi:MAG: DUF4242 domain-containing protein [Thermoleophilia bacterium]